MSKKVKYDKIYVEDLNACGDPYPEFVDFFARHVTGPVRVLDLGCGQGRDALFIARLGHSVLGVDVSEVGVQQMLEMSRKEGLDVEGLVGDAADFRSRCKFDVVLLDRVVHQLPDEAARRRLLGTAARLTRKNGCLLIADTKKNRNLIRSLFSDERGEWSVIRRRGDFLFVRKDGHGVVGKRGN